MDKLERLYALHGLFDGRRRALPLAEIVELRSFALERIADAGRKVALRRLPGRRA